MAKYEYRSFRPYAQQGTDFDEDGLNELARDGWRVAHVLPSRKLAKAVLLLEREAGPEPIPMTAAT